MLVCLGMDISWHGSRTSAVSLAVAEKLQPGLDVRVGRIQLGSSLVRIQCIINLVVAALILEECQRSVGRRGWNLLRLTRVPRSYQTSEMNGFSRMALLYASRASLYWLI